MRGDGRTPTQWASAADQRKALDALAATLRPSELTVPKPILDCHPAASARLGHVTASCSRAPPATPSIR